MLILLLVTNHLSLRFLCFVQLVNLNITLASRVRQNDVRVVVQSGANDAFSPVFSAVSPGVAVLVDERDLDRARELYSSFFGEDTSPLTGPAFEDEAEEEAE